MKLTDAQKERKALEAVLRRIGDGKGSGKPLAAQVTAELRRREEIRKKGLER